MSTFEDDDIFETKSTRSAISVDAGSVGKRSVHEEDADSYSEKSFKESDFDDDASGDDGSGNDSEAAGGDSGDDLKDSDNEGGEKKSKSLSKAKKLSLTEVDEDKGLNADTIFGNGEKKKKMKKSKKSNGDDGEKKKKKKKRKNTEEGEGSDGGESPDKKSKKKKQKVSSGSSKKKSKRMGGYNFFADEAHEADDDSEEEDLGDAYDDADPNIDITLEQQEAMKRVDVRNEKINKWQELSAESIAEQMEERYRSDRIMERAYNKLDFTRIRRGQAQSFSQLPTIQDPKIYKLRCKIGQEQVAIRSLMLKAADMRNKEKFSRIKSAFCGNAKGYIFVEAISEMLMRELINGLRMIFSNSIVAVPLNDMTSVLNVSIQKKPLQVNQFVRLSRGPLKGDLARIVELFQGGEVALIQAVPRPVYSEEERNKNAIKKDASVRPPQRLLDIELAKASEGHGLYLNKAHVGSLECYTWMNEKYYKGYLVKEVNVSTYLQTKEVNPTLEELKWFQATNVATDSNATKKALDDDDSSVQNDILDESAADQIAKEIEVLTNLNKASPYVVGDLVKVTAGELQNVIGRVVSVHDEQQIVKIVSLDKTFMGTMEVEMTLLMKFIEIGAHVKVMAGQFMGQSGRVVSMSSVGGNDQVAAILTDGIQQEIQCNTSYLQLTDEISIGSDQLAGYKLHDLVALNENESAVIINVGINKLRVINNNGNVKDVNPQEIRFKQNAQSLRATELDGKQVRFKVGDILHVDSGPHSKQTGTVKHIAKRSVWLHNNLYHKDNGIFVVKARNCSLSGGSNNNGNDFVANFATSDNRIRSAPPSSATGNSNFTPMGSTMGDVGEIRVGSSVKIIKGAHRSFNGTVLDVNGSFVMVQLDAKMKKVSLQKDSLKLNSSFEATRIDNFAGGAINPYAAPDAFIGADTPHIASQTPAYYGGETPKAGAETPGYGGFTPAHGSATPSHYGESNPWRVNKDDYDTFNNPFRGSSTPMSYAEHSTGDRNYPTSNTITPSSNYGGYGNNSYGGESSTRSHFESTPTVSVATTTPSIAPTSVVSAHVDYEVGMVVQVKAGEAMGKRCVIVEVLGNNQYNVKFRDGMGRLTGDNITLGPDGFKLADPVKNQTVKFISGKHIGSTGVARGVTGKDAMVVIDGEEETKIVKCNMLAWMHDMSHY